MQLTNITLWGLGTPLSGLWPFLQTLTQILLGVFFTCSGTNKLFHRARHLAFCRTLCRCGVPKIRVSRWIVAGTIFLGGIALLVGFLTPLVAFALFVVLAYAILTDGWKRTHKLPKHKVINRVDYVSWQLYLPELWMMVALTVPMTFGASPFSVDQYVVLPWLRGIVG
jgi:putative oxidoreductase